MFKILFKDVIFDKPDIEAEYENAALAHAHAMTLAWLHVSTFLEDRDSSASVREDRTTIGFGYYTLWCESPPAHRSNGQYTAMPFGSVTVQVS